MRPSHTHRPAAAQPKAPSATPGSGRRVALIALTLALGLGAAWLWGAGQSSPRGAADRAVSAPGLTDAPSWPTGTPTNMPADPALAGSRGQHANPSPTTGFAAGLGPDQPGQPNTLAGAAGAATTTGQASPAPNESPAGGVADAKPHRIALARSARDPQAARQQAAQAAALPPGSIEVVANDGQGRVQYQDRAGRPGLAELQRARVGEADLGVRFMPGSQVLSDQSQRIQDPTGGQTAMATLTTAAPLARVASYYRDQLAQGAVVQESIPAPGELMLSALDQRTGVNRVVWLSQQGSLVQARVAQAAPPVTATANAAAARRP